MYQFGLLNHFCGRSNYNFLWIVRSLILLDHHTYHHLWIKWLTSNIMVIVEETGISKKKCFLLIGVFSCVDYESEIGFLANRFLEIRFFRLFPDLSYKDNTGDPWKPFFCFFGGGGERQGGLNCDQKATQNLKKKIERHYGTRSLCNDCLDIFLVKNVCVTFFQNVFQSNSNSFIEWKIHYCKFSNFNFLSIQAKRRTIYAMI